MKAQLDIIRLTSDVVTASGVPCGEHMKEIGGNCKGEPEDE